MAKRVRGYVKLQIPAGKATPAPPIGPALGQHGVAIMEFCKQYNERTQSMAGQIEPELQARPSSRRLSPGCSDPATLEPVGRWIPGIKPGMTK